MKIPELIAAKKKLGKPSLSFEIFPPKKEENLERIDETLELLCDLKPDFISVTFGAGGSVRNSKTVEIARKIKERYGVEPVAHLTCLYYSEEEISEMLKELEDAGVENILALRGDVNPDYPIKKDFAYASDLVRYIKEHGSFSVSGGCYPEKHLEAPDMPTDLHNLKKKVDAGADHLISQLFFDNRIFYDFCEKAKCAGIYVPIDAGVMPVTNKAQIEKMVNICGASIPQNFRKILQKYEGDKEALMDAGLAYTTSQVVDLIANDVDGIHLYTMNKPAVAKRICDSIRSLV
ncbi:MAG: methylenetetrahydrofolate reductase [NAD(P)H] [Lachnospiraceae bacterium]|nr:methylenetetrahydrofolate reductase [NAD(P)H] [Lachnospiraceae bacterium]MBP5223403.1 methylenetetrahydrofolate reductase [NAD(P)H] [Lachnospiraceae bacterium]